jgi:AcrR family transcriptional regulator
MSRRRAELVSIAADLFAERGYAGVTVDDIGDAAGVSGPALYHHFTSKEALLGGDDVLERLVRFHAEFAVDDRSLITVHLRDLVHTSTSDHDRVRSLQGEYVALWTEAIRRRRPDYSAEVAAAAAHAVFGLINSTPFSARLPRDEMVELLSSLALRGIGAPDRHEAHA